MDGQAVRADDPRDTSVSGSLAAPDFDIAAGLARQTLALDPDNPDVLRTLLLAQLGLRDVAGARATADRLTETGWSAATLDAVISARLAAEGAVAAARDDVAAAVRAQTCPPWALEAARARIAIHVGDYSAARAILVRGIEREPEVSALRALMTEVLLADGSAAQARAVIAHLGQPPTAPGPEVAIPGAAGADRLRRQAEDG
jgi:thioredoxin-like negative regulator of GroEL